MFIKGIKPLSESNYNCKSPAFCAYTSVTTRAIGKNIAALGVPDTFSKKAPAIQYAVIDGKLHIKFNQIEGSDKAFIKKAKMEEPPSKKESVRKLDDAEDDMPMTDEERQKIINNSYDNEPDYTDADHFLNETLFGTDF